MKESGRNIGSSMIDAFVVAHINLFFVSVWTMIGPNLLTVKKLNLRSSSMASSTSFWERKVNIVYSASPLSLQPFFSSVKSDWFLAIKASIQIIPAESNSSVVDSKFFYWIWSKCNYKLVIYSSTSVQILLRGLPSSSTAYHCNFWEIQAFWKQFKFLFSLISSQKFLSATIASKSEIWHSSFSFCLAQLLLAS